MSVPVSVPFADDYLESGTYPGLTELIAHPSNGFLYGCYEGSSPAANGRIVKIDQLTFTQITVANLPKPNPIDMHYDPGTDRFYIIYRDDSLTLHPITRVEPLTLAMDQFTSIEATLGPGSITGDGTKLYVVSFFDEPSYIFPITLSTGAQGSAMPVTGFTKINCLRFFGTKLYAESLTEAGESVTVLRISTSGVVEEASEPIQITGGAFPVDDMGDSSADIWMGNKDTSGLIRKFSKSALTQLAEISTGQLSRCTCVKRVGGFIWAAFENGRAIRVDPLSSEKRNYTLSQGRGYHSEFTGDSSFIFTYNASTGAIGRYHIPAPITPGGTAFAKRFGGTALDVGIAVAFVPDGSGNFIAAGYFSGTGNFSNDPEGVHTNDLPSNGGRDIFLAKYDPDGTHLWSKHYGGSGDELVNAIAVDASGNIYVVGQYTGASNLGGAAFTHTTGTCGFIAKYDSSGNHVWSHGFGSDDPNVNRFAAFYSVAIGPGETYIVVGGASDAPNAYPLNLGGLNLESQFGGKNVLLAKFNSAGVHQWSYLFAGQGGTPFGLAIDALDNIYIGGNFQSVLNLGRGDMHADSSGFTYVDLFIAQMNSLGVCQWNRNYGGNISEGISSLALDSNGDLVVCGTFFTRTNLGGGNINGTAATGDGFIAKYSKTNGDFVWALPILSSIKVVTTSLKLDGQNNIFLAGYFTQSVSAGGQAIASSHGGTDGFVAKFSRSTTTAPPTLTWGTGGHGGSQDDQANGLAVDSAGNSVTIGYFIGQATIGGVTLNSRSGSADVFLLKLNA